MQVYSVINKIEKKYPIEMIIAESLPVWQFLRNVYANKLHKIYFLEESKNPNWVSNITNTLSNILWEKQNRRQHYPAVLFTDVLEERPINGLISDKLAHNILSILKDQILVVLDPLGERHKSVSEYFHSDFLSIYSFVFSAKFKIKKIKIENSQILDAIERELGLNIPYEKLVNQFFQYAEAFQHWIRQTNPKVIFINCFFSLKHQALIYSAKKHNVITAELQHGIISKAQTAYMPQKKIGNQSFPDYLLSFGELEKSLVSPYFISSEKIIPIGNYYLENILSKNNNPQTEEIISSLRRTFKRVILISSQKLIEHDLILFLLEAAEKLSDTAFILVPRRQQEIFKLKAKPKNLLVKPDINLYQSCQLCDFHSTVFSTFAAESIYMGIPNILINLNNLSEGFFSEFFSSHAGVKFVNKVEGYVETIKTWNPPDRVEIKKMSLDLFAKDNRDKIKLFLDDKINL